MHATPTPTPWRLGRGGPPLWRWCSTRACTGILCHRRRRPAVIGERRPPRSGSTIVAANASGARARQVSFAMRVVEKLDVISRVDAVVARKYAARQAARMDLVIGANTYRLHLHRVAGHWCVLLDVYVDCPPRDVDRADPCGVRPETFVGCLPFRRRHVAAASSTSRPDFFGDGPSPLRDRHGVLGAVRRSQRHFMFLDSRRRICAAALYLNCRWLPPRRTLRRLMWGTSASCSLWPSSLQRRRDARALHDCLWAARDPRRGRLYKISGGYRPLPLHDLVDARNRGRVRRWLRPSLGRRGNETQRAPPSPASVRRGAPSSAPAPSA